MRNPIVLFDGVCNLCNSSINFIIKNDKKRIFRFAPLQSDISRKLLNRFNLSEKDFDTVILIQGSDVFTKSSAALQITKQLQFPFNLFIFLKIIPKFLRDKIYDYIAANRYTWFGRRENCMVPTEELKGLFLE